jgi:prepilin-type N-terminal cleavage/methylation domain-containing protein
MKFTDKTRGFTIVEMLTVMGIIAILIGLLVPALNQVKDFSKRIQQKAQFHSIDVALELFKNEFGAYPESKDNSIVTVNPYDATPYCGANKLAEALVGIDLLGFHPKSGFTALGVNDIDGDNTEEVIYHPAAAVTSSAGTYTETAAQNVAARKKFIDLENANAFQMKDIYTNYGSFLQNSFVLCDIYSQKRNSGTKTGMPILYFKARTAYQFQDYTDTNAEADDVYYIYDNSNLLDLGTPADQSVSHPLWTGALATDLLTFEEIVLNKQVQIATKTVALPDGIKQPYRADSYFLLSAGKDGLYGTSDDLLNFEKSSQQ